MANKPPADFVARVTQLDAVSLDKEIHNVLKSQLVNIIQGADPSILVRWEPEIDALLSLFIMKASILRNQASFGQQLLGIKYGPGKERKILVFTAVVVGGKYLLDRSRSIITSQANQAWNLMATKALHWIRIGIQAASLLNIVIFLGEGKYPTLLDRLLQLQPIPASKDMSRSIGYSYMTRELLWHGLIELLVFILPLVNYKALYSQLRSKLIGNRHVNFEIHSIPPRLDHQTCCAVCNQLPVLPYHIGCGHIFCAYCLNASLASNTKFECPICGVEAATNMQPVTL